MLASSPAAASVFVGPILADEAYQCSSTCVPSMGLSLEPALPAWSESEQVAAQGHEAGEASLYMKEFLYAAGLRDLEGCGCHSLKRIVLSWAAKSTTVTFSDRRLLGHRVDPGVASPWTYARDEQTRYGHHSPWFGFRHSSGGRPDTLGRVRWTEPRVGWRGGRLGRGGFQS